MHLSPEEALFKYLDYIKQRLSTNNFKYYNLTLKRFISFCGPVLMKDITSSPENKIFHNFENHLRKNYKLNDATLYYCFTHIKKFLIFCVSEGYITKNVNIEKIINFNKHREKNYNHYKNRIPHAIYEFDEINMRKYWIYSDINLISLRNTVAINLAFDTGLKTGELLSLKKEHIDVYNNKLLFSSQKNKRNFTLPYSTILLIKAYIEKRNDNNPFLFISYSNKKTGENLSSRSLERIIKYTSYKISALNEITMAIIRNSYIARQYSYGHSRKEVVITTGLSSYFAPILNKFSLKQDIYKNAIKNTGRYLTDFKNIERINVYPDLLPYEKENILKSDNVEKKNITRDLLVSEYQATEIIERLKSNQTDYIKISKRQKDWHIDKNLFIKYFAIKPQDKKIINGVTHIKENISFNMFLSEIRKKPQVDPEANVNKYFKRLGIHKIE